jgi:GNAT superfamily N-acetyltransferase
MTMRRGTPWSQIAPFNLCVLVPLCETLSASATPAKMKVRDKEAKDHSWIESVLDERWGAKGLIIVHGERFDACRLPALIAGETDGLATFQILQTNKAVSAELITLDAVTPNQGVGTILIEELIRKLHEQGVKVLRVTTTNDNLDALRFYQRRGFRIVAVHPGAVDEARKIKPTISQIGEYGIPIRDEIELELQIAEEATPPD